MKPVSVNEDIAAAVAIAENAAREAGQFLMSKLGEAKVKYQKASRDDLLDVDLEAEKIILNRLQELTPTYGILSEEAGKINEGAATSWIVDPLDGSANYQHGSPIFGVALALIANGDTIAGIIYLPSQDEMFTAVKGNGAKLNGQPMQVSKTPRIEEAIVYMGDFSKSADKRENAMRVKELSTLANNSRRIRMVGTAATDFAYLACGRADAVINHSLQPWDVRAGHLLVLEAGGQYSSKNIPRMKSLSIWSNGIIHQSLENLLVPRRIQIVPR